MNRTAVPCSGQRGVGGDASTSKPGPTAAATATVAAHVGTRPAATPSAAPVATAPVRVVRAIRALLAARPQQLRVPDIVNILRGDSSAPGPSSPPPPQWASLKDVDAGQLRRDLLSLVRTRQIWWHDGGFSLQPPAPRRNVAPSLPPRGGLPVGGPVGSNAAHNTGRRLQAAAAAVPAPSEDGGPFKRRPRVSPGRTVQPPWRSGVSVAKALLDGNKAVLTTPTRAVPPPPRPHPDSAPHDPPPAAPTTAAAAAAAIINREAYLRDRAVQRLTEDTAALGTPMELPARVRVAPRRQPSSRRRYAMLPKPGDATDGPPPPPPPPPSFGPAVPSGGAQASATPEHTRGAVAVTTGKASGGAGPSAPAPRLPRAAAGSLKQTFFGRSGGLVRPTSAVGTEHLTRARSAKRARNGPSVDAAGDPSNLQPVDLFAGLSREQQVVFQLVQQGRSVFFTGPAGTGKSFLLRRLVMWLKEQYHGMDGAVAVTASTGIAACNIGGTTVHSFAGVGLRVPEAREIDGVIGRPSVRRRWGNCRVLLIDEISMLDAKLLDTLEVLARRARNRMAPFGGIQLILCGDFFQLPPVGLSDSRPRHLQLNGESKAVKFAFQAKCWHKVVGASVVLGRVFRQADDTFVRILNELRVGRVSKRTEELLAAAGSKLKAMRKPSNALEPTRLFPRNAAVDAINDRHMQQLRTRCEVFQKVDEPAGARESDFKNVSAVPRLALKVGAQVVLLKNHHDHGLVNGSRGVVLAFRNAVDNAAFPIVPLVEFTLPDGGTKKLLVEPHTWFPNPKDLRLSRTQIPLRPAWALSMHKSQGMTVPFLRVSFKDVFEYGQAYVALSRATSLETTIIEHFHPSCVKAHPAVVKFYDDLKMESERAAAEAGVPAAEGKPSAGSKPGSGGGAAGAAGAGAGGGAAAGAAGAGAVASKAGVATGAAGAGGKLPPGPSAWGPRVDPQFRPGRAAFRPRHVVSGPSAWAATTPPPKAVPAVTPARSRP